MRIPPRRITLAIWLGYLFLVAYGSLVPLDYTPLPLERAWDLFKHMPMLQFEAQTRTDWTANITLALPTGLLTTLLFIEKLPAPPRAFIVLLASLFSLGFAASVEFSQLFFPPRTCSLNDLVAQGIGGFLGSSLAASYSNHFGRFLQAPSGDLKRLPLRLLEAYLLGYVALSLFPYDVLLSAAELEQKWRGSGWGWLLAGGASQSLLVPALKLLTEIILTLPFGLVLGYRLANRSPAWMQAFLLGLLLGGGIEIAQFFTASGVSQGLSILTRIIGVCAGLALWKRRADGSVDRLAAIFRRFALPLGAGYLLILLQVNGWLSQRWLGADYAKSQLDHLHFVPFYYHYYTSEAQALVSLLSVCLMYLPIGLFSWSVRRPPIQALFYAFLSSTLIETGKLFLQDMRPDPSNVILGTLAGWGMAHLLFKLSALTSRPLAPATASFPATAPLPAPQHTERISANQVGSTRQNSPPALIMALLTLGFSAYWAATFPTQPLVLLLFLMICAAVAWYRPLLLVTIVPAALPVLDLAPWSGRFYLDEFDLLLLASLPIAYACTPSVPTRKRPGDFLFSLTIGLLVISYSISTMRGLLPWQTPDANTFTNYYSPFNALRIGKGALWAFLCYGVLRRLPATGAAIRRALSLGIATGLALTVAVILWERLTFSGLFNFSSDYRVTGPFSAMHTGGAYIECFLAIATPFLILNILHARNWPFRLLGVALLLATTYAMMVTFARNGYMAFSLALVITLFFALVRSGQGRKHFFIFAAISAAMFIVAMPILSGQFVHDRMATIRKDLAVRQAHWQDALNIRSPDWLTTLFGMGLGRFPESHYLFSAEGNRSGTYLLVSEGKNVFLRLVAGDSIFMGQLVPVEPRQHYILKLDARSNRDDANITVPICEKWLISSYNCVWRSIDLGKESGTWRHFELPLSSDALLTSHWYSQRPIRLALYNGNTKASIDVDNIRLETVRGDNLVANGDFSEGLDHWFFTTDGHLQWHTKSLFIALLFDQGWLGVVALGVFSLLAITRATGRAWQGHLNSAANLASFCSFLAVGLFDTLIDAPRFLFLFFALGGFCLIGDVNAAARATKHDG